MQRIILRPFGPIKDVEIDVNDMLVFIGPQASGKSTISKAVYFFKSLKDDLVRYVLDATEQRDFDKSLGTYAKLVRSKSLAIWGPIDAYGEVFFQYHYGNGVALSVAKREGYLTPEFNREFEQRFYAIVDKARDFSDQNRQRTPEFLSSGELLAIESEKRNFLRRINSLAGDLFNDPRDLLFIPAARGLLATLSDQLQAVHPYKLDYLTRAFIDRIDNIKPLFSKSLKELVTDREKLTEERIPFDYLSVAERKIESILKARYRNDPDGEKLFHAPGDYVKLKHASSGQQEAVWILQLMFLLILENRPAFIVIEEPEAHLYPEAQQQMVHLIALLGNVSQNQIVITTHSPYILSSLNNLLYAHRIGNDKPEQTGAVVEPKLWLDPARTDAFFVSDGVAQDIKDQETGLIRAEMIDSASEDINRTFESLFNLDET